MNAPQIPAQVSRIITAVRKNGDSALVRFSAQFDHVRLTPAALRMPPGEIRAHAQKTAPGVRLAISAAARQIRAFHAAEQKKRARTWFTHVPGLTVGQMMRPVESVGMYVPGGRFSYPSTVLMTAIPARAAGVRRVVMASPPGKLTPEVLYAATVCGISEIYRIGGAQAIAALAFGTKTIMPVAMIVGPGNAFVNEAKRQVFGTVGIDALAGPSEVAIIADQGASPAAIAADLCAQAEHDPQAIACLYTDDRALAAAVRTMLPAAVRQQVTITVCSPAAAVRAVNAMAPEHLELLVKDPRRLAARIEHAGAIFAGYDTPTALGDYFAGPSHVLPTGKTARFSSGLSAASFIKRTSYIQGSPVFLRKNGAAITRLAAAEGLENHARSVRVRVSETMQEVL